MALRGYSDIDEKFFWAAFHGDLEGVKTALIKGADINKGHPAIDGWTPLIAAGHKGRTEVVEYLLCWLEETADPNITNKYGNTPLHRAACSGHTKCVLLLLANGANTSIVNVYGDLALDKAKEEGHGDIVNILLADTGIYPDISAYENAMKEGHVSLTNKKLVLSGPPCTGKTAFKNLLFNWSAPKHHHSTPLASRPIQAMERITDKSDKEKVWDVVNPSEIYSTLTDAVVANVNIDKQPASLSHSPYFPDTESLEDMPLEPKCTVTQTTTDTSSIGKAGCYKKGTNAESSHHFIEVVKKLSEKKRKGKFANSTDFHKATWVHVLDSGGQPQFADISRAFLRGNAVNIITHKLTEKLSDKPRFTYSLNGKVMTAPSELQMTNMQLIEHFIRSVGATKSNRIRIGNQIIVTKPFFIIIGTYFDQATSGLFSKHEIIQETIANKNHQLLSALGEFRDHFIFFNEATDELIFPVDNLVKLNRKKISAQIRERIMSQKRFGFKVPIPIRWYVFELQIREKASTTKHGIVSLQSCYDIGATFNMNERDVQASLVYFDAMTLCLYYKKILPNVIFTNPQYLLDMVTDIVRISFITSLEEVLPEGQYLSPDDQELLREDGVFEESLLDILGLPFIPQLFTKELFLCLLEHMSVIARIHSLDPVRRYFMPVVLSTNQLTQEQKTVFSTSIDPLVITFNSKVVPQGLFPTLVVSLLSRDKEPKFFIDSHAKNFPRQLRHTVSLYSEELFGSVFLCDEYKSINVYFTGNSKHCYSLRQVILQAISTSTSTLGYDEDTLVISALVACNRQHIIPSNNSIPLHPVTISYEGSVPLIGCSVETLPVVELKDDKQRCWLIEPAKSNSCMILSNILPKEGILSEEHAPLVLSAIRHVNDWEELGIYLGIKYTVIEHIKRDNFHQVTTSRMHMVMYWLQGGTATSEGLSSALKAIGKEDINVVTSQPTELIKDNNQSSSPVSTTFQSFPSVSENLTSVACKVLQSNISTIKEVQIKLDTLVDKMLEEEIISNEEKREIMDIRTGRSTDERIDMALNALQSTVSLDVSAFTWFIQVLRDQGTRRMTGLANKLEKEYHDKLLV